MNPAPPDRAGMSCILSKNKPAMEFRKYDYKAFRYCSQSEGDVMQSLD
jgi:hypothetical protein